MSKLEKKDDITKSSECVTCEKINETNKQASKLTFKELDESMVPDGREISSSAEKVIIIVLDVTGSNLSLAKITHDRLPMVYEEIEKEKYLDDFKVLICACGDAYTDKYPLQVGKFACDSEVDEYVEKMVLEGNGGAQNHESYELLAHYLAKVLKLSEKTESIVLFIADEMPYETVNESQAEAYNVPLDRESNGFEELRKITNDNVFCILNKFCGQGEYLQENWVKVINPKHVIKIKEGFEKAIVDILLGVIATSFAGRTLSEYADDMKKRGQDRKRIAAVLESLGNEEIGS